MINDLGGATIQLVKLALDASVLRHAVIANNIANANTPGFKPQQVSFEQQLLKIEANRSEQAQANLYDQINAVRPSLENGSAVVPSGKDSVELDVEMKNLAENSLRYQALLTGMGKRSSIIGMAISQQGGK